MDTKKIDDMVASVMKRANQLAPNSNFKLDGFDGVKLRMVAQAIIEELLCTMSAPTDAKPATTERDGWERAAKALAERAQGHKGSDYELYEECLQCASMLHDLKPAVAQSVRDAAQPTTAPEEVQRQRMAERFAGRASTPATADFDLPAPNDPAGTYK